MEIVCFVSLGKSNLDNATASGLVVFGVRVERSEERRGQFRRLGKQEMIYHTISSLLA